MTPFEKHVLRRYADEIVASSRHEAHGDADVVATRGATESLLAGGYLKLTGTMDRWGSPRYRVTPKGDAVLGRVTPEVAPAAGRRPSANGVRKTA